MLTPLEVHAGSTLAKLTVQQFRNVVLDGRVGFFAAHGKPPEGDMLKDASRGIAGVKTAVRMGRVFDFGWLPNTVIIPESKRAGRLLAQGHIHMPFNDWFLIRHEWEAGVAFYLARPLEGEDMEFAAVDLVPLTYPDGTTYIGIDTLVGFRADGSGYAMVVLCDESRIRGLCALGRTETEARAELASNVIDPLVAALGILHTDNVPIVKEEAAAKLNAARKKSGKPPIPPYYRIQSQGYITAILHKLNNTAHRTDGPAGGLRTSPVSHVRRGHVRHLSSGKDVWVRDALINFRETGTVLPRAGYNVIPATTKESRA